MRFSMLYSGGQILSFKSCLVFYAGDSLKLLHILWYHKIDVLILKITFTLWYHKYDFLYHIKDFVISPNQPDFFLCQNIDFISKNRICNITKSWRFFFFIYISQNRFFIQKIRSIFYITKSILWYQNRFGHIKFDFVISQSGGFIVHTGLFQDFINNKL